MVKSARRAKRKTAIARATAYDGSGKVTINRIPFELVTPDLSRDRISEPIILASDSMKKINIDVVITGGGFAAQCDG